MPGHQALEVLVPEERNRLLAWQMGNNALPHLEGMQTDQVGQKSLEWRIRLLKCAFYAISAQEDKICF